MPSRAPKREEYDELQELIRQDKRKGLTSAQRLRFEELRRRLYSEKTRPTQKFDPWENPRFTKGFTAHVQILYMTREEIERQHETGEISDADWKKYWKDTDAKHLVEVSIEVPHFPGADMRAWIESLTHKGGSFYAKDHYAIRCGGANQHRDPLNVFFLF